MRISRRRRATEGRTRLESVIGMSATDAVHYDRFYPYYAELCALSEIRKKPGFGAEFRSGMGGHALLYLSGVFRDRQTGYPVIKLCDPDIHPPSYGVGISVNSHYKNANWVATEGRHFVFHGALEAGEPLTRAVYERTQAAAMEMGILDGVAFHEHLFREKPYGMSRQQYMYEISVATDYAVAFGRNVYRTRVPLDRPRMSAIVDFLNGVNAPYRNGEKVFRWNIFNNNCSHLAHNALAAAKICEPWPTGQFFMLAAFSFPVPKNELVDLVLRTNDMPIDDPTSVYRCETLRRAFLDANLLPTSPGALASALPIVRDNDIYDADGLRLIFYDNPFWGPYRPCFERIFSEPRYFDLASNLRHFLRLYDASLDNGNRRPGFVAMQATPRPREEFMRFCAYYDRYIEREANKAKERLALLYKSGGEGGIISNINSSCREMHSTRDPTPDARAPGAGSESGVGPTSSNSLAQRRTCCR